MQVLGLDMTGLFIGLGILVAIVMVFRFIRHSNTPEGMAKSTARTMLRSLMAIQNERRFSIDTNEGKLELYRNVLRTRPGYTEDKISATLKRAIQVSQQPVAGGSSSGLDFDTVVFVVVSSEYADTWRRNPTPQEMQEILGGIDKGLARQ